MFIAVKWKSFGCHSIILSFFFRLSSDFKQPCCVQLVKHEIRTLHSPFYWGRLELLNSLFTVQRFVNHCLFISFFSLFVIELFVILCFITSDYQFGILKLFLYFLDSRNKIETIDTSVPFRDVKNSDLSNNHINTRQTDSVFYHQSHHDDLTAGNNRYDMHDRQDSRYVSAGSINMSRNIDGISQGFIQPAI